MSKSVDGTTCSPTENVLARLSAKMERLFARMNELYNSALKVSNFASRDNEHFMAQSEIIDDMRGQFEKIVDDLNDIQLTSNPKYKVDYQPITAFEDLYLKVRRTRNNIIESSRSVSSSHTREVNTKVNIKLPPIELPSFNGQTENWPKFYESFKANIHNNSQLTDSQRVQYLVGKLTHDALKISAGIVPSGDTYTIIWDSLVKKYQDKRALGTHYLYNIFDTKGCNNTPGSLDSFVERYSASVLALKQLGIDDLTDFILLHCALRKIDSQTVQAFELSVRDKTIPSYNDLISFIRDQVKILQRSNLNSSNSNRSFNNTANVNKTSTAKRLVTKTFAACNENVSNAQHCIFCSDSNHSVNNCSQFKNLTSAQSRFEFIKSKHACVNCLSGLHTVTACKSTSVCDLCKKRHHTFLHFDKTDNKKSGTYTHVSQSIPILTDTGSLTADMPPVNLPSASVPTSAADCRVHYVPTHAPPSPLAPPPLPVPPPPSSAPVPLRDPTLSFSAEIKPNSTILLSTAQVYAKPKNSDGNNNKRIIRCLIDNGSQNNLITTDCCRALNLPIIPLSNSFVKGIGSASRPILGYVYVDIESRVYSNNKYAIHALVVDCITDQLPAHYIDKGENMGYLEGLPLADLTWNIPGNIDVVLGAQLFPYIYLGNRVDSGTNAPPALLTAFGYVLMGDYPTNVVNSSMSFSALALNDLVQKFWQLEEVPGLKYLSPEETQCENIFLSSVTRADDGRYCVPLPFSKDPSELGNSRAVAQRRFMALERKFKQSPDLQGNYNKVIGEYIDKDYLSEVSQSDITDEGYYIPHHAVTRSDKPMPRVVLDASAKTHTGVSLNDILHTGPNLQADLTLLLLDFRLFPVALTADIKQMYLQIQVPDEHRKYLRILFRFASNDILRTYQFNRVPFGLKSSPYLAMRTVRQLANDMRPHFPDAAHVAESKLYMDDLVHSVPDDDSAARLARELISLFKSGAFDLVKWNSNSPSVLENLPESHRSQVDFTDGSNSVSKVLGLSWEPCDDIFFFTTSDVQEKCTKRSILSMVARLFDVLGLVGPVILYAKLLIKELWLCDIGWDDTPPDGIIHRFSALRQEFPLLSTLKIPRHVGVFNDSTVVLVAFCDASMNGYGSVIYLHSTDPNGKVTVRLLCAKSKVSPTKVTTLARLELCAAVLMSKLIRTVRDTYASRLNIAEIYAFSDSTIALSWIHSSPHRWSVFVSNRVAQCQENLSQNNFYHIAGKENPSDCLSRGMLPSQLVSHKLWWNGPAWLQKPCKEWPVDPFVPCISGDIPEHKTNVLTATVQCEQSILCSLARRISTWDKLLRIIVYVLKFVKLTRSSSVVSNLSIAERYMIASVQQAHFKSDIITLKQGKQPSKKLQNLSVFLDQYDTIRIGGRISKSDLPFEVKHPVLLPKRDHVVDLIINHFHVKNCHTGPGLLMSIVRQKFWILDARTVIRAQVRKCNSCFRVHPSHPAPRMADLPSFRITEAKAFVHTGVDYAGPLKITLARRRGQQSQKAYICLFVCLVTKAVHVELVSDLTTNAFLAAFNRFISRRGPVSFLYSDNGTNFIGAKAQLDDLYKFLIGSEYNPALKRELIKHRIEWKMIPPLSPHFGGMWESNIKSLKTHLYRVIGTQILTYEELQTVLVQIECIMNSRPLTVVSSDPYPDVITPAHFLMSTPLQSLPAADLTDVRISLTDRKQLLDHMVQSFWKKWHLEYLHTLQVRQKWTKPDHPIVTGTVVLVGRDDAPPLSWPLGVITEVHPGSDKIVRVATVKTKFGIFKRPIVKLYPIPTQ